MTYDIFQQLHVLTGSTSSIDPREKEYHGVVQPLYEKCLSDEELEHISCVYKVIIS